MALRSSKTEKVQLVVTDEPAIAEYLVEKGVADPGVPVVESADVEDVRGINVAGDVPISVAAYARSDHVGGDSRHSPSSATRNSPSSRCARTSLGFASTMWRALDIRSCVLKTQPASNKSGTRG